MDNSYRIVWHEGDQLPDTLVPDENIEDERSGTDEECQAEFVVSSDDEDPGDDNGDVTSEDTDPSELIYQYLMFRLLLSDNNSRLLFQAH